MIRIKQEETKVIKGYFFNAVETGGEYDRTYNAEDVTSYLDKLVGNGVFPTPSTQLQVTAGTGLQVTVAAGQGWVDGHKLINTAALNLSIDAADVLLPRIDRVVFYADTTNREMGISVIKGTPSSSPTAPALTRTAVMYQMSLATVRVNAGATAITNANITDTRANSNVCGWVAGLIQQVDTSTLFTQWETAYTEFAEVMQSWMASQQTAFEQWMATLTSQLLVGAYLNSYEKTATLTIEGDGTVTLDMPGYAYDATDVFFITINGLAAEPDEISIDGEKVTFANLSGKAASIYIKVVKTVLGVPSGSSYVEQMRMTSTLQSNSTISASEEE